MPPYTAEIGRYHHEYAHGGGGGQDGRVGTCPEHEDGRGNAHLPTGVRGESKHEWKPLWLDELLSRLLHAPCHVVLLEGLGPSNSSRHTANEDISHKHWEDLC